jgi:rare lipoprotein A (peptidoglycan hydrolase)
MAVNTQKLLPAAKTTSVLAKANVGKIFSSASIKIKKIDAKKFAGSLAKKDELGQIVKTLTDIDIRLKLILGEEQKQQSQKKKEKEKAKFQKAEEKLEAPKEAKKFKLPGLSVPGMSFLDRIKRFLFFTALGWLFTKFQDQLPKLVGIVKTITQVYGVAENIFKFLLESFVNLIDRGYKTYDKVRDLAKSIGGEKAQQDFDKLSGKLNEYINYVLIGGMALTGAINSFNKAAGRSSADAAKEAAKKTTGEVAKRAATKGILQKTAQSSRIGIRKATQAVIGKQATKQLLRLAKGPLSRLPLLGGLVEFGLSWALGDPVGKAAFRGIGTILLGAVGSLILPGFGTFIGGWAGAELAGKLYELLFENKQPKGKVQKKAAGGPVTRGGKTQGAPTRDIRVVKRKPPKVKPQSSQPGKDVGGKKKIRELYPDPSARTDIEGEQKGAWWRLLPTDPTQRDEKLKTLPNSYKALTNTAKVLKDIPFGIGALMGGAVDIALGQKLPKNAIDGLSNGISYLINALANQQVAKSISSIQKEIATLQTGGIAPRLRDFSRTEKDEFGSGINKVLSNLIQQKVDEAIREVQKQLMPGKYDKGIRQPGEKGQSAPPSRGPGGGTSGPTPTGENGRLPESSLKSVGQGGCRGGCRLWTPAANAYLKMKADAAKEKIYFQLESAYRSYEHQQELYDAYKRGKGALAAPPGQSDHGLGKAIDLYPTAAQDWVRAKGRNYGWYWPPETGEPWHFVYVGGGRLEPQKQQTQLPKQQPQIPDNQNYGVKEGEQKRVRYNNQNYVVARDKNKWRVYKVNPTTGLFEEVDRTDKSFLKVLEEHRKTQSPTSPKPQQPPGQQPSGPSGLASFYGGPYDKYWNGRKTASGQVFDEKAFSAALRDGLPFGMYEVTYNGKTVLVRGNDRGNFGPGNTAGIKDPRELDLSYGAAKALGITSDGRGGKGTITYRRVGDLQSTGGGVINKQDGGYIPKQSPKRDTQRLSSYPSYSAEGGMMIAIQPMIIEKPVPVPSGKNRSIIFPIPVGVNNSSMQSLSRG